MFDPIHLLYAAAGLVIGWVAHLKVCDRHTSPASTPVAKPATQDPLDSILEMIKAEQQRKSKLDQLRDILNPK